MKKLLIIVSLAFLFVACGHGKTRHFPTGADSSNTAEVFVIRNNNLFGWGFSLKVYFDDTVIARLRAGDHVSFHVETGMHTVGISKSHITVPFSAGQKYYFLISADISQFGFEIDRLGSLQGENWIAKTNPLQ
jgi:hypothetical protein